MIAPPSACTASATARQPAAEASPWNRGTFTFDPAAGSST